MKRHVKKSSFLVLFVLAAVLVFAHSSSQNELATITFPTEPPLAGEPVLASIHLIDEAGNPVTSLDVMHERKLHVIFIGQDLRTASHIHPEDFQAGFSESSNGTYIVLHTFPKAGFYAALLDYTVNGTAHSATIPFSVVGNESLPNITYDFSRTKQFGNHTIELRGAEAVKTGANDFTLYISKDMPVTDLQMYLGSEAHIAAIREDLQFGGHTHAYMPGGMSHLNMVGMQHYYGPEIPFEYTFSEPGAYALIGQFRHNNTVVTTNFLVNVTGEQFDTDEHSHTQETAEKSGFPFSVGWVFIAAGVVMLVLAFKKMRK
ncbi:MAG TPA: hypothetical protein VJJ82_01185 [Candidatus Nanoarchaeia archaeon]|nr:hypothetical protein [Candidatus Nanoarchaeia archaeon]